jgi:glucose/arabinose dehydrogenase
MDWAPGASTLWTVVNERDMLGDDVQPDYLTSVRDGAFYGWPYSYQDFLTGFIANEQTSEVYGRPVGVAVMPDGSLLVADDAGGTVWRVSAARGD